MANQPATKDPSPDENALSAGKQRLKLEPLSTSTSPEQQQLHTMGGFNISLQVTPRHDASPDGPEGRGLSAAKQEKARRKLVLEAPQSDGKSKKARVTTPVSRSKTAAGNSPGDQREMDPSTISLSDPARRPLHSRNRAAAAAAAAKYDLDDELGPDPTDGSDEWLRLFDVNPRPKRRRVDPAHQFDPALVKKEEEEEEEYEEDVEAAAAAAARFATTHRKQRQPPKLTKKEAHLRDRRGSPVTPGGRLENSLLVLTRKFMDLRGRSEDLNLNEAAATLGVQKRRLYDITNVLEGIDMIVKTGKNSIRWCQEPEVGEDGEEFAGKRALDAEIAALDREEHRLDDLIRDLSNAFALVKEDPTDKPYAYVNFLDLQRAADDLGDKMTIAVKAGSSDATVEVADPVETGRFEMAIRCQEGLHAMLVPSGGDVIVGAEGAIEARPLAPGMFTANQLQQQPQRLQHQHQQHQQPSDHHHSGSSGGGGIVLPPCTSGGAGSSSSAAASAALRQPCDDLITPSKMVEDNSCLSEYLSPLKFLNGGGPPMSLLSSQDGPYLSIDTPSNGSVLPPGSGSSQPGPSSSTGYFSSYLDGAAGPSISDMYSHEDWF